MKEEILTNLATVVNVLNNISVSGKANLANLSGSMQVLEDVIGKLTNASIEGVKSKEAQYMLSKPVCCDYVDTVLPCIEFVGGETENLTFYTYYHASREIFNISDCTCSFAISQFHDRNGTPILIKPMSVTDRNALSVTLDPKDTVDLAGKYLYQISIRNIDGEIEIPKQGVMYIMTNVNKSFSSGDLPKGGSSIQFATNAEVLDALRNGYGS